MQAHCTVLDLELQTTGGTPHNSYLHVIRDSYASYEVYRVRPLVSTASALIDVQVPDEQAL
jgi:hypothetical protein